MFTMGGNLWLKKIYLGFLRNFWCPTDMCVLWNESVACTDRACKGRVSLQEPVAQRHEPNTGSGFSDRKEELSGKQVFSKERGVCGHLVDDTGFTDRKDQHDLQGFQ